MDMYGIPAPESFRIDDLLDFSNSELFSPADQSSDLHPHFPSSFTQSSNIHLPNKTHLTDFTDNLYLPNEEVAELEWLSNFVDDSFTDFTTNELANVVNLQQPEANTNFHSRSRSKRSRAATSTSNVNGWIISTEANIMEKTPRKRDNNPTEQQQDMARRCTHCASEKTPQWRTGPLGPKTLCNACGVRYKSGRLVPEYRPAASPTFVLTQHSNSHRKVMELRRQKEIVKQEHEQQLFHHHHHVHQYHHHQQQQTQKNFEVC